MVRLSAAKVYGLLLALLLIEVLATGVSNGLVLAAALGQFALLLLCWLEVGRTRGWVQVFGVIYLGWLMVLTSFVLIEFATR